jgi:hypothetical protein
MIDAKSGKLSRMSYKCSIEDVAKYYSGVASVDAA